MPVLRPTHAAKRAFARQTPCNSIVSAGVMTEKADGYATSGGQPPQELGRQQSRGVHTVSANS